MIGISLMTNQFIQAAAITEFLKAKNGKTPIVWGGVHPTVQPESCLPYADILCIGEGEDAIVELADALERGLPHNGIRNLWFKSSDGVIRNPLRPLIQDIDSVPYPDYSFDGHHLCEGNEIGSLTAENFISFKGERFQATKGKINYPIMTSRGCPFSCTYCINSAIKKLYPGERHLRWRSKENVFGELKKFKKEVASIGRVLFVDDNFTARTTDRLEGFCKKYAVEIGIPFFAQVSPLTVSERKMEILLEAGCEKITMGVETSNHRVAGLYNRSGFHKVLPEAVALILKYRLKMKQPPSFQFIIDNPYETFEESLETLKFAVALPRPWDNPIYSLMLFPGTPLYVKAKMDGLIKNETEQIYGRDWLDQSRPFFRFWIRLYRKNVTPFFLKILLIPWVAKLFTNQFIDRIWRMRVFSWMWDGSLLSFLMRLKGEGGPML